MCALLVLVLAAAYRSVSTSVGAYVGQRAVDLWVAPVGTDNLIRSSGLLAGELADSVRAVAGVAAVAPVVRAFVTVKGERGPERGLTLLGIGYLAPDGGGGPPQFVAGESPRRRVDVALDRAAAYRLRVGLRDTVWLNGQMGSVVGITAGTNLLATQFVFSNLATLAGASGVGTRASFLTVRCASDAAPADVARRIEERLADVVVFGREEFVANNRREVGAGFLPLLALVTLLGISAATMLVALLVQGIAEERREELALLLALGVDAPALTWAMIRGAGALVLGGAALGALASIALAAALDHWLPIIPLAFAIGDLVGVLVVFGAGGMAGTMVPLLALKRIDPLEAFWP